MQGRGDENGGKKGGGKRGFCEALLGGWVGEWMVDSRWVLCNIIVMRKEGGLGDGSGVAGGNAKFFSLFFFFFPSSFRPLLL